MRRLALVATIALSACGSAGAEAPGADLEIRVWPQGKTKTETPRRWTLRCGPAGGTLPRSARACRRLRGMPRPFAPVDPDAACTAIFGGPAVAHVRGRYRGRRVSAWFKRTDGCEIARWNRVRFLFVAR